MSKNEIAKFEIFNGKFYILEQREEVSEGKKNQIQLKAWVFQKEKDAIVELNKYIADEDVDLEEELDESIEFLSSKYNLQEVEIMKDKYNMKAISWLKIALVGMAKKE